MLRRDSGGAQYTVKRGSDWQFWRRLSSLTHPTPPPFLPVPPGPLCSSFSHLQNSYQFEVRGTGESTVLVGRGTGTEYPVGSFEW